MAFKILTENSVDNTNIDGARAEHFNAGLRDGIVKGAFNEGIFSALASNVISFDTCELRISGHRVIIDEIWTQPYRSIPTVAERRAVIAEIVVDYSSNVSFRIFDQLASVPLIKDNLFRTENGAGTYQVEIGRFTLTTNGTIADVKRTLDLITGGSSGMGEHFVSGDITTTMLESGMKANATAEDVYDANGDYKQTDFSFEFPETAGTVVTVNDIEQENLSFTSDPQTQLNDKVNKSDIDSALSSTSENPVQNKIVKNALDAKANTSTLDDYVTKTTTQEVSGAKTFTGDNTFKTSGASYGAKIPNTTSWEANKTIAIAEATPVSGTTVTGQTDTVTEYYVSQNKDAWYRKWASGWKECGGTVYFSTVDGNTKTYQGITLPIKITNILGSFAGTTIRQDTSGDADSFVNIGYWNNSTSNTTGRIYVYKVTTGSGNMYVSYRVWGY